MVDKGAFGCSAKVAAPEDEVGAVPAVVCAAVEAVIAIRRKKELRITSKRHDEWQRLLVTSHHRTAALPHESDTLDIAVPAPGIIYAINEPRNGNRKGENELSEKAYPQPVKS